MNYPAANVVHGLVQEAIPGPIFNELTQNCHNDAPWLYQPVDILKTSEVGSENNWREAMNVLNALSNVKENGNKFDSVDNVKVDGRRNSKNLQNLMNGLDLARFQFPANVSPKLYDSYSALLSNKKAA